MVARDVRRRVLRGPRRYQTGAERAGSARSDSPDRLPAARRASSKACSMSDELQGLRADLEARRWRRRWWTRACCGPRVEISATAPNGETPLLTASGKAIEFPAVLVASGDSAEIPSGCPVSVAAGGAAAMPGGQAGLVFSHDSSAPPFDPVGFCSCETPFGRTASVVSHDSSAIRSCFSIRSSSSPGPYSIRSSSPFGPRLDRHVWSG